MKKGYKWIFNPPHAPHTGSAWQRMIGVVRQVLEAMLVDAQPKHLTDKVITTLMAEVSAFINAGPFIPVSNDPDMPEVLTPGTLLTQQPQQLKQPAEDVSAIKTCPTSNGNMFNTQPMFSGREGEESTFPCCNVVKNGKTRPAMCRGATQFFSTTKTPQAMTDLTPGITQHRPTGQPVDLATIQGDSTRHYKQPITETILRKSENQ